jgi:hypothetical protein
MIENGLNSVMDMNFRDDECGVRGRAQGAEDRRALRERLLYDRGCKIARQREMLHL